MPSQQEVRRSDMEHWAKAGDFTELQSAFGASASSTATAVLAEGASSRAATVASTAPGATAPNALAMAQVKSGGSWFYWIAGLSLINSISAFSGSSWRFIVGLGITQVFDGIATKMGSSGKAIVLLLDLLVAGLFVLFGVFAVKGHGWAFIVGMVLFTLDGLLFLLFGDWIGVAFHAFVLYCLFRGFAGSRQLARA